MVKADVDEAIRKARTEKQFFFLFCGKKDILFKFGKDITIRPEGRERGLKLKRNFGENYSLEAIRVRILEENELPAEKKLSVQRHYQIRVSGNFKQTRKIGGLRGLYLHYCYLLGILPKNHLSMSNKQVHVLFREDLLKLNTIQKRRSCSAIITLILRSSFFCERTFAETNGAVCEGTEASAL